jgi:general secretion pathway protein G
MKNKAFTLIELLVVIAIIGLLAAIVIVNVNSARDKAKIAKTKADLEAFKTALQMYAIDNGAWPCPGHWFSNCGDGNPSSCLTTALAPYLKQTFPSSDSWGRQYSWHYHPGSSECTWLGSAGPSGTVNCYDQNETWWNEHGCAATDGHINIYLGTPGP